MARRNTSIAGTEELAIPLKKHGNKLRESLRDESRTKTSASIVGHGCLIISVSADNNSQLAYLSPPSLTDIWEHNPNYTHPSQTQVNWINAALMLGQRRRRWTNIETTLDHLLTHVYTDKDNAISYYTGVVSLTYSSHVYYIFIKSIFAQWFRLFWTVTDLKAFQRKVHI